MVANKRHELDMLLERALKETVSNEDPPDKVWENIALELSQRHEQPRSRRRYIRELASEAMVWAGSFAATARIMLTPFAPGNGEGWSGRMLLAGHASIPAHYIQR